MPRSTGRLHPAVALDNSLDRITAIVLPIRLLAYAGSDVGMAESRKRHTANQVVGDASDDNWFDLARGPITRMELSDAYLDARAMSEVRTRSMKYLLKRAAILVSISIRYSASIVIWRTRRVQRGLPPRILRSHPSIG